MQPRRSLRVQSINKAAIKSTSISVLQKIYEDSLKKTAKVINEESTEEAYDILKDSTSKMPRLGQERNIFRRRSLDEHEETKTTSKKEHRSSGCQECPKTLSDREKV